MMDERRGSDGAEGGAQIGPALPGYEIAAVLGRGAFGVVYRAWQPAFHRQVAIKVLMDALDDRDAARLLRECQALGTASTHPNIVTVHEAGFTAEGRGFLVMEYLGGGSLADAVARDGRLRWQDVTRMGVRLAGALETAHRADVLHRDIKPDNVLLSDYGEPKLADFGIARLVGATGTRTGPVYASVLYAAPEVLAGYGPSTVRSDVYALGGTLLTLLTGQPPFVPMADEPVAGLIARIVSVPPDLKVPDVPPALLAVIGRALAKDPFARQATAAELGEALREVQREEHEPVVTDMPIGRARVSDEVARPEPAPGAGNPVPWLPPPGGGAGAAAPPPTPAPARGPRRPRTLGSRIVIAAAVVAAITILALIGSHDRAVERNRQIRAGPAASSVSLPPAAALPSEPTPTPAPAAPARSVAAVASPARCAAAIGYGQTVRCTIAGAGDVVRHDFTGAAGEHVFVRAVRLSGDFSFVPSVSVLDAGGASSCPEPKDCALLSGGRHTLVVQDSLKRATGDYTLYVQRTTNPVGCGQIAIGEAAEGTLAPPGAMGCATFTAGAGDRVRINAVGTGTGPQFSEVDVLQADGGGSACPLQDSCQLTKAGRYVVLVAPSNLADPPPTGPYRITVTCLAGPCRGG